MPKWMGRIDEIRPVAGLGFAVVLAGANPKNLLLAVAGATASGRPASPERSKPSPTWSSC